MDPRCRLEGDREALKEARRQPLFWMSCMLWCSLLVEMDGKEREKRMPGGEGQAFVRADVSVETAMSQRQERLAPRTAFSDGAASCHQSHVQAGGTPASHPGRACPRSC